MKHFLVVGAIATVALAGSVTLNAGVIEKPKAAPPCRNSPIIKNLTGLKAQRVCGQLPGPKELTKREMEKLASAAKAPEDHLTVARYYRAEAETLDAKAAGYETAAAKLRNGPIVKNLMAPNTPARYEFSAKGFRDEATSDRALATAHEKMVKTAIAKL